MKMIKKYALCLIPAAIIFIGSVYTITKQMPNSEQNHFVWPQATPSHTGWLIIWLFLVLLWAIGSGPVFSSSLSLRRKRNIFLNVIILALLFFMWNYQFLIQANFAGALAISIANILLSVVVWFMYLVTDKIGGYLFTPTVVWSAFLLYLSISAFLLNK